MGSLERSPCIDLGVEAAASRQVGSLRLRVEFPTPTTRTLLSFFVAAILSAVAVTFVSPAPVGVDGIEFQLVYYAGSVGPVVPFTRQLAVNSVATCDVCAIFYENCDSQGVCARTYLGRTGTVSVTRADRDINAGRMIGSASNLRFDEWNLNTDRAEASGLCVTVGNVPACNGAWNFDGGQPPP